MEHAPPARLWRVLTHPLAMLVGWLATTLVSLAAFFEAELTTCEQAPARQEPGSGYCDFVQSGGSYLLLVLAHLVVLVGVILGVAYQRRSIAGIAVLIAFAIAAASYALAEFSSV